MSRNYKFHNPEGVYFVSFADVEWSHTRFTKGNEELSVLTTTHESDFEAGASTLLLTRPNYDYYTFIGK